MESCSVIYSAYRLIDLFSSGVSRIAYSTYRLTGLSPSGCIFCYSTYRLVSLRRKSNSLFDLSTYQLENQPRILHPTALEKPSVPGTSGTRGGVEEPGTRARGRPGPGREAGARARDSGPGAGSRARGPGPGVRAGARRGQLFQCGRTEDSWLNFKLINR